MTPPEPWEAARNAFWEAERGGIARTGDGWDWATVQEGRRGWEAAVAAGNTELAAQLRAVYRERARLVAFLAACYPSAMLTDSAEPDWPIVFVSTPSGQMSWHIAKADLDLFAHVPPATGPVWDGHTTSEKYERLAELIPHAVDVPAELAALRDKLAARDALITKILATFGKAADGMRSRVSRVTFVKWKRDADKDISEEERRMADG